MITLLALLVGAPTALAWHGDLVVRKVNIGGPAADVFTFKVEAGAYGQPNFALVPAGDYTGAPWMAKSKPDNPFSLTGAPSAAGPFTRTGAAPTEALFTGLDSGGQTAAAPPAVRDWRRFRITETSKPAGYTTSAACTVHNNASAAGWDAGLDPLWGAWTVTPTTAGGGDGVETTLRFLPDTVAAGARGPWTVVCTFTNTYTGPPPSSGTGTSTPTSGVTPPSATPATPSATPVTPSGTPTPRAVTARVVGRTGCVIGPYAIVDVRGRGIVRVSFRLNGRTVKTLKNDNVAGMYRLRLRSSSLPRGASRVTADVRFTAASSVAPRRLAFVLNRCPGRTDRPPLFTG